MTRFDRGRHHPRAGSVVVGVRGTAASKVPAASAEDGGILNLGDDYPNLSTLHELQTERDIAALGGTALVVSDLPDCELLHGRGENPFP